MTSSDRPLNDGRSALRTVLALVALAGAGAGAWLSITSRAELRPSAIDVPPVAAETRGAALEPLAGVRGGADERTLAVAPSAPTRAAPAEQQPPEVPIAWIAGIVLDESERPFPHARVELHERARGWLGTRAVDRDGRFTAALSAPGTYSVRVEEESLADGVLPPWRQEVDLPGARTAYEAQKVEVPPAGGHFEVELRVFAAAVVRGTVVGPGREPIEGVQVRVISAAARGQPAAMNGSTFTGADGSFALTRVRAGLYRLDVITECATEESHRNMVSPLPRDVTVLAGSVHDVGELQVGGGRNTIRGRIVDQDGDPLDGVRVTAYPGGEPAEGFTRYRSSPYLAASTTDALGFYELRKLPATRITVQAAADYMEHPLGERRAAFWVEPITLDLGGDAGLYQAAPLVVPESRPFTLRGTVVLDAAWATARELTLQDLRVDVELDELAPALDPVARRASFRHHQAVPIEPTGEFVWLCETPHQGVKLLVRSSRDEAELVELRITPTPHGVVERRVTVPE